MNSTVLIIISAVIFMLIGLGVGFLIRHSFAVADRKARKERGDEILSKAKEQANEIKYNARREAKEYAREEKDKVDDEVKKKRAEIEDEKMTLQKREKSLNEEFEAHKQNQEKLKVRETELEDARRLVEREIGAYKMKQTELTDELSRVSEMTREEAKEVLLQQMEEEAKVGFAKKLKQLDEEAKDDAEKNAKMIISTAIQRYAGEYVGEKSITTVELPSDDIKGRLIGREGRNIRAFEQICGVDLIIDDTPEVVVISSFNVVRREIAKLTIEKLIADGRIHPAKIEEFYEKSKTDFDKQLRELGEKAQMEIGVHGIHPEVLKLVGALNFRTSYTQNQYQHALESAFVAGSMAAEMGLNVKQARRAALLHDVGKVLDASQEGSHAVVGANFLKKYGESPDIVHAVKAHHDDIKPETVLAHVVAAADALSGARPGARKAMMESYVSRLTDIEEIVNSFEGVSNCYAISGGREVRVIVENSKVDDEQTVVLSRDIAHKIESEMSYPGTIKITVVRETKAIEVAR